MSGLIYGKYHCTHAKFANLFQYILKMNFLATGSRLALQRSDTQIRRFCRSSLPFFRPHNLPHPLNHNKNVIKSRTCDFVRGFIYPFVGPSVCCCIRPLVYWSVTHNEMWEHAFFSPLPPPWRYCHPALPAFHTHGSSHTWTIHSYLYHSLALPPFALELNLLLKWNLEHIYYHQNMRDKLS